MRTEPAARRCSAPSRHRHRGSAAGAQDRPSALRRPDRDVASAGELDPIGRRLELPRGEHRPQHEFHLDHCEAGAQAAPATAAERNPCVGAGRLVEEPLRAEGIRVRINRRIVVDQVIEEVTGMKLMVKPILQRDSENVETKSDKVESALKIMGGELENSN